MRWCYLLVLLGGVAACTTLPEVPEPGQGFDDDVDFPDFLPMRDVDLDGREAAERNAETKTQLEARVAGLKARAAKLRSAATD